MTSRMDPAIRFLLIASLLLAVMSTLSAQVDAPVILFRRGAVWNAYAYAKTGGQFSNWTRSNYGLDWPGYDPEWISANIGGHNSYIAGGGIWFAAKDSSGKILGSEDWAMYGTTVDTKDQARYKILKHRKRWPNGENYWGQADPTEAQELLESEWIPNPGYIPQYTGDNPLPLRVTRKVRQWAGSKLDDNYFIVEYVLKNISDTLRMQGAYVMLGYAISPNNRSWRSLFPSYNAGVRAARFIYEPTFRYRSVTAPTMYGYADNSPLTPRFVAYGKDSLGGPSGAGEYLAPGRAGFTLLYSSPDTVRRVVRGVNGWSWCAVPDQQDLYGPFGSASVGLTYRYQVVSDPKTSAEPVTNSFDPKMTTRRMWSLMSLGPWNLRPGDSVVVTVAEFVAGISYDKAIDPQYLSDPGLVGNAVRSAMSFTGAHAIQAFANNYNVPDPPAAPAFTVRLNADPKRIANILEWNTASESIPDRDYTGAESYDLAGYRIYRSSYLPLGPWRLMADVMKGDTSYLRGTTYTFYDDSASIGEYYYYAVTAYDIGHAAWPPNTAWLFPETGSNRVPPMESSVFASLYAKSSLDPNIVIQPFQTTIPPAPRLEKSRIIVSPNPFVLMSGAVSPGAASFIQFINLPNACTIRIYTVRGDLVKTIRHDAFSGIVVWNLQTDYGQFVVSGVYLYHIESPDGTVVTGKIGVVR